MKFGKKRKAEVVYVPERTRREQILLDRVIAWTNDGTLVWRDGMFSWSASLDRESTNSGITTVTTEAFTLSSCTLYIESHDVRVTIDRVCPDLTEAVRSAYFARQVEFIERLADQ